jgi:hypothetical protein
MKISRHHVTFAVAQSQHVAAVVNHMTGETAASFSVKFREPKGKDGGSMKELQDQIAEWAKSANLPCEVVPPAPKVLSEGEKERIAKGIKSEEEVKDELAAKDEEIAALRAQLEANSKPVQDEKPADAKKTK